MTYSKELHDRVRQNLRMFDYPRFDDGDIDDLLDEIARLTAANKWVSVSERLPEVKGEYLCYLKPDIFISFYGDSWSGDLAFRSVIAPTHWQPLPTPPTGGE